MSWLDCGNWGGEGAGREVYLTGGVGLLCVVLLGHSWEPWMLCVQSDGPQVANLLCSCPFLQGEGLAVIVVRLLEWINQQFEPGVENAALETVHHISV